MRQSPAVGAVLLFTTILSSPAWTQVSAPSAPVQSSPAGAPATDTQTTTTDPSDPDAVPQEGVDISIPGGGDAGEDIVVIGRNIPEPVRATPQVVSVLSTEDIARTGEGDIAGALQRVTGLSVVGQGFVYVRGLGDRYSLSLLNGSPLPSPEPLRRVVPLDIFPSRLIASALVQKSYSPNFSGEFGGGVINLTTVATPDETFFNFGASISGDTETTGHLGYTYYGSDLDILGFDDGTRSVPGFVRRAGELGQVIGSEDATRLSNARTTVLQRNFDIPANFGAEFSAGTSFQGSGDFVLGVVTSLGYSNTWQTRDALQQSTNDPSGQVFRGFRSVTTDNRILVNGLVGVGAEFGEHRIRLTNVYIHDTLKQGRLASGFDFTNVDPDPRFPDPLIEQNTFFFERELYDVQGVGEFRFGDFGIDLRGTYAKTKRDSPYEREFVYSYDRSIGDYVNNLGGSFQTATIAFSELDEEIYAGGVDLIYDLPFARPAKLTAGYAYSDTERTSTRYFFRYRGQFNNLDSVTAQTRPDFLISDFSLRTNGIVLLPESTGSAARYDAGLEVHAGYGMAEIELFDGFRLTGGVRYEQAEQFVLPSGGFAANTLENDYFLPALTATWNFAEDMQLRLHGSKTIARPQFRELAPQLYQDFASDRQYVGNPFLNDTEIYNGEARYEWFFGRDQRFTLAGFYKRLDDPIEPVAILQSNAQILTGFSNAPRAELYGAEVEFQKYVPLDTLGSDFFLTKRLVLIGNYTYSKSELQIGDELAVDPIVPQGGQPNFLPAGVLFDEGAPLTGQSEHLVNLQLGFEDTERLSQATILFTYASDRTTTRGPVESGTRLPDFIERPGIRLDFVAREAVEFLGTEMEIKFEARNLTGTRYREFQSFGDDAAVEINTFDVGSSFSLGVGVDF